MATSDYTTIKLTQGYSTIVDIADNELCQYKWQARINPSGQVYAKRTIKNIGMHRVIMGRVINRDLEIDEYVDHIDGDTLNNRRSNLRIATRAQNQWNCGKHKDNKTGYKGVSRRRNKFVAQITVNGKKMHLGYYEQAEDAYKAYCKAAEKYHGEYRRLE